MGGRKHKITAGPRSHRRLINSKMTDQFELSCLCGEEFHGTTPADVLTTWKAHRRSAEEAS